MKNLVYAMACAILALVMNIQTARAAFPVSEKPVTENVVQAQTSVQVNPEMRSMSKVSPTPATATSTGVPAGAWWGIAAAILAIVAIAVMGVAGIVLGLAAVILGVIGLSYGWKAFAIGGIIVGAIAFLISLIRVID